MTKVISIINHKGGVGKTTTTVNLGDSLSRKGKKVLLIDFDPQANLTQDFGQEETQSLSITDVILHNKNFEFLQVRNNLDLIKGDLGLVKAERFFANQINTYTVLKRKLEQVSGYDYVLIDCPPSLGFFTINALNSSTHALICTEATNNATSGLDTIMETMNEVQYAGNDSLKLAGILISNLKNLIVQKEFVTYLREEYSDLVLKSEIRSYKAYVEASACSSTVFEMDGAEKAQKDFENLAIEIEEVI